MTADERQRRAPLAAAMCAYGEEGALAFHTPGHKQGLGAHALLRELVTEAGLREEVSLMEELDDLHEPTGCIEEAQDLAAALYGADAAFFAVNGTTGAIHAMFVAALSPGDTVLVPRNVHRSVFGGLVLADARPVYIEPVVDEALGIAHGLSTEAVREACRLHPEAKALLLVSPTYYGVASDVRAIAEIVHEAGMALLVDEAHGAHLAFSDDLPESAIAAGADLVAQSTHKLLGAMTQASLLLLREGRIEKERVQRAMSLLTSTSPNYLLLASLDIARLQMAEVGAAHLARAVGLARKLRREVNATPGLFSFGEERMGGAGAFALDPLKLTVTVTGLGLTGAEAAHILRHEHKIEAELFDAQNVLFLLTYADTEESAGRLLAALRSLAQRRTAQAATAAAAAIAVPDGGKAQVAVRLPAAPPVAIPPREAFYRRSVPCRLREAAGRIAAETIAFYPPGIPVICTGEVFTAEVCRYIEAMAAAGLKVTGAADASLRTLRVVADDAEQEE
ncbi:aminotransferase class I/II-fold pyridoxal phosphate-dependent enzyme [Selenomonas sputigena]|uniref:Arginine decarboxylase n=1 Tax=Selenomonas sputigena (strain ATCC 35185 / DSM 20758 / CCUG 44933 / VPI D19B-28) TaxID=546271 RepID=C9LVI5_SELS3|nr:aminotransferase class I/II-fold pyridoxal phosphate-dependent enzyme [Selenomonas sputigena]AEB99114.1 Arginine decarboxylase [Selenomonas sputigena ATCC 35185]EEX77148.1 Orn/Lys/Arg decarboxylase, major domain protein [Selenomonas sputigena ATCC 35185]